MSFYNLHTSFSFLKEEHIPAGTEFLAHIITLAAFPRDISADNIETFEEIYIARVGYTSDNEPYLAVNIEQASTPVKLYEKIPGIIYGQQELDNGDSVTMILQGYSSKMYSSLPLTKKYQINYSDSKYGQTIASFDDKQSYDRILAVLKTVEKDIVTLNDADSSKYEGYTSLPSPNKKTCDCQQKLQNITKELDGYYEDAHNPAYTENTRERYAQQYQALVKYHSREGYSIRRNSENKHVVSLKEIAPVSEETSYFDK
mgnify:FL=1|jgi:hypothetical protein